jgi:hypothetical protein
MTESNFQKGLKSEIKKLFPDCILMKNDASDIQGIPDLLILFKDKWAALECKKDEKASHRPNQDYYVNKMNSMGFASFIYPKNKEEVLNELTKYFMA